MINNKKIKYNGGAAMIILVFFFIFISLTILIGIVNPTIREFKISTENFKSKQTYFLAESGVEDVIYRLKNNKQIGNSSTLVLGDSDVTTNVTDISNNQKEIVSLGNTNSIQRKIKINLNTGIGASFNYGVLTGIGGFVMDNGSKIVGSVYSNGTISGSGTITGSATSANSSALTADQFNGSGTPDYDIIFGKVDSAQDFSQSFKISETNVVNKVSLYLKKVGSPSNLTVRIVSDSNGSPSSSTIASGTLSASLVSNSYGFVDVPLSTTPQLSSSLTYWIVIDGGTSSSKYYVIGANSNGYSNGVTKIGSYGGSWSYNSPSTIDSFFSVYVGGIYGSVSGINVGENGSGGNVYSHTVNNVNALGTIYCKSGSGNNKTCDTSRVDPVQVAMPISEQNILEWKQQAEKGGVHSGNYVVSSNSVLGPKKITGNLSVNNGKTLSLSGTLWVQGNLLIDNNSIVNLVSSYGASEEAIIVDGTITISNNSSFGGSGTAGSYILCLTTSSSSSAISLSNNAGAVSLYAANGTIDVSNNGTAKALTGYYIHLNNNAVITYDSGLANMNFSGGPSGTWKINSWREVE